MNHSNVIAKIDNYESRKQQKNVDELNTAFALYKENEDKHSPKFFEILTKFVITKIKDRVWDTPNSSDLAADVAQDVVLSVWTQLENYDSDPGQFNSWVERIAYVRGCRAFSEVLGQKKKFSRLTIKDEETGLHHDNPETVGDPARRFKQGNKTVSPERHPEYSKMLPDWIQGIDLEICKGIRQDMTYKVIAEKLGLTELAIKKRCSRMKARNVADKAAAKAARIALYKEDL